MAHLILFEHRNFRGAHKHVFAAEANLAASEDNFFNDRTSSIVILEGTWTFYRDVNFGNQIGPTLVPGFYP